MVVAHHYSLKELHVRQNDLFGIFYETYEAFGIEVCKDAEATAEVDLCLELQAVRPDLLVHFSDTWKSTFVYTVNKLN
jgi:hypothetical protein